MMRASIGCGRAVCDVEAPEVSYVPFFVFVTFPRGLMASILVFALFTLERRVSRVMTVPLAVGGGFEAASARLGRTSSLWERKTLDIRWRVDEV